MFLVGSACVGMNVGTVEDCATLCDRAASCGFLPSALGWAESGDLVAARANCEWRCGNSPGSDATVATIVDCFTAPDAVADSRQWCADEADERHAEWSACAAISRCLAAELKQHELHGDVELTVQMLSFTDYEQHFAAEVAALYPVDPEEDPAAVTSCTPSLCGQDRCAALACPTGECEETADESCDATLCPVGQLTVSLVCADLGAREITATIRVQKRVPVVDVLVDAAADLNTGCMQSALELDTEAFGLEPGPIQVVARVVGALPAATLVELGLLADAGADPAAQTAYCLEFIGPPVIAHTGRNTAVVPIGAVDELRALLAAGGTLRRCDPCPPATICGP